MPIFDQKPKQIPQPNPTKQINQSTQPNRYSAPVEQTEEQKQKNATRNLRSLQKLFRMTDAEFAETPWGKKLKSETQVTSEDQTLEARESTSENTTQDALINQNDLETTIELVMLEETSPEIAKAYAAVMRFIEAQDFEGAAKFLKTLPKKILTPVLEKMLGKAPKFSAIKIITDQLADILKGSLARISQSLLDKFNKMKSFKAGEWKPKGNIDRGAYVGTEVHKAIAREYERANRGDSVFLNDSPISSILKSFPGSNVATLAEKARLKPDILNVTKRHLYEIKPETNATAAVLERDMYVELFKLAGVEIERGPSDAPGTSGVVQAPGGFAVYYSPVPGVILYRKRNGDFDPVNVSVVATAEEQEKNKQQQPTQSPALASTGLSPELESLRLTLGLSLEAFVLYLIFSEGSRILFPPRNLLPIP